MEKNRIYISGNKESPLDESAKCFRDVERMLLQDGWKEVNNSFDLDMTKIEDVKKMFNLVLSCDAAFFLDGWIDSQSCIAEFSIMKALHKKIIYEHCLPIYLAFEKTEKLRMIIHEQTGCSFCKYRDCGRSDDYFFPRVIFSHFCFSYLHIKTAIIGQLIHRDRTTINHMLNIYEDLKHDIYFNDIATKVETAYLKI